MQSADFTILGGDFNTCCDNALDYEGSGRAPYKCPWIAKCLQEVSLIDVWRQQNPSAREFTHEYVRNGIPGKSRLDYFFCSPSVGALAPDTAILRWHGSDHWPIGIAVAAPVRKYVSAPAAIKPTGFSKDKWSKYREALGSLRPVGSVWDKLRFVENEMQRVVARLKGTRQHAYRESFVPKKLTDDKFVKRPFVSRQVLRLLRGENTMPLRYLVDGRVLLTDPDEVARKAARDVEDSMSRGRPADTAFVKESACGISVRGTPIKQVTMADVRYYCKDSPPSKAIGADGVNARMVYEAPDSVVERFVEAANSVLVGERLPHRWADAYVKFLYKKGPYKYDKLPSHLYRDCSGSHRCLSC